MNEVTGERPKRVLVCGCDERFAQRVGDVLGDWQITRSASPDFQLEAIRAAAPSLILSDASVPAASSVALLKDINRLQLPLKPKVVILAHQSRRQDVICAMREGAFSYFSRPYFEAAFDEMLRHAVGDLPWSDSIRVDSGTPSWLRVIARCELATADRVVQFMNEVSDLDGQDRESMGFALKEILVNAMEYGGGFDRERLVEVSYVRGRRMVLFRVRDPGPGFSLEELTHAAISNPPEEPVRHLEVRDSLGIRPGGFGVLLSRKLVDDLIYSEQGNDVLLIKYVDFPDPESSPGPTP